jgi:hypothetical protein
MERTIDQIARKLKGSHEHAHFAASIDFELIKILINLTATLSKTLCGRTYVDGGCVMQKHEPLGDARRGRRSGIQRLVYSLMGIAEQLCELEYSDSTRLVCGESTNMPIRQF